MQIIGHRGARFEAPENTLAGFRYAIDLGLTAVEFDIRMTRDGHLVVIHDATVDRTTNGTGEVSSFTLAELQTLDARAAFPDWPEPCVVPTFGQVLDVVEILPELLVEIKRDTPDRLDRIVAATLGEIARRDLGDRVTVTSFDPYALEIAQRAAPLMRRGYIGDWDEPRFLETAARLGCAQIDVRHSTAGRALVARAKAQGMRIVGWPTNSADDLASVRTLNADLFCTDAPTLLMELHRDASAGIS